MLDLARLAQQMQGISQHLAQEAEAAQGRVRLARRWLTTAAQNQETWVAHQRDFADHLAFTAALPVEPLTTRVSLDAAPAAHTVLATDGSQISPSHHEIAYCYLINVGRVVLHYGQGRFPLLDSLPEVIYRPEDLYQSRPWGIGTEEWMGHRRTVAEAVALAELGAMLAEGDGGISPQPGTPSEELDTSSEMPTLSMTASPEISKNSAPVDLPSPVTDLPSPVLAMADGSLIYWFLDGLPAEARDHILTPILAAWDRLRRLGIPIVSYLSATRSSEGLNFLRLPACPFPQPHCGQHCNGQSEKAPCGGFMPLRDAVFWATELEPGQRSPFWRSSASILELYGDQRIYFCYLHVGVEVARVEMPEWVVADAAQCDMALRLVLAQVQKGYGYPVALAEAHNQAVVRGGDRQRFFALLEREMVRAGLKNIGISAKEARKRGSIA
ncbi:DNA double-strand break repair nuclease NurA [Leptolyngbya sp. BL0902]|uniref:DNA double-strand break repair nuclease NurA n=1 Tax=Leptolyngbya sp. BL0902 TaxID=1115757 RepID=UPI0018E7A7B8|nr:DNA double-strand break repair nuclease NurA [Leptolyngbya sp. BL0902]